MIDFFIVQRERGEVGDGGRREGVILRNPTCRVGYGYKPSSTHVIAVFQPTKYCQPAYQRHIPCSKAERDVQE